MPVVPHNQILRVHAAAVAVGLTTSRDQLLAGIPQSLVAAFPRAANSSAQILSDLDRLNDLGQLPDGSMPLRTWLENGLALHGLRADAEVFREVLALATVPGGAMTASVPPATPTIPAATGGTTINVNLQGGAIGSLAVGDGATSNGRVEVRRAPEEQPAPPIATSHGRIGPPAASAVAVPRDTTSTTKHGKPAPNYPDDNIRALSEKLATAQARKQQFQQHDADATEVTREILDLKRQLREGGQLRPGDSFGDGRFLLLDVIGRGGFATVWLAHDEQRQRDVAIKVLHPNWAADPDYLVRFKHSAKTMSQLHHPAVVRVLEPHGEDGGWHCYVMDLLPGSSLQQAVLEGNLGRDDALPLMLHICDTLAFAHSRGIVHRDIKPANILRNTAREWVVTDFDSVSAHDKTVGTRNGVRRTHPYADPMCEEGGAEVDSRVDVYSLGMTTLFCLYGQELPATQQGHWESFVKTIEVSYAVQQVLLRAISRDRDDRYSNAGAFRDALQHAREHSRGVKAWKVFIASRFRLLFGQLAGTVLWIVWVCIPSLAVPALAVWAVSALQVESPGLGVWVIAFFAFLGLLAVGTVWIMPRFDKSLDQWMPR